MAGLLLSYWTGILQLSIAVLEVRNLFRHDSLFVTHCEMLGGIDSPSLSIDMDRPSQIALRIYQTVVNLSSSLEGCTVAYVPLELAERYFIDILANKWQGSLEDDNNRAQHYMRARIGLECCKLGFLKLHSALQNYK
jgi:hypothetical protein